MAAGAHIPGIFILATLLVSSSQGWAEDVPGKKYIIQMSSSQVDSGYANYLVPPLAAVFNKAGFQAMRGPGADFVVNIVTHSDVGKWVNTGKGKEWLYTLTITVGISPENYDIPFEGTPKFGVAASLLTPNGDREDELDCLIRFTARNAIDEYRPSGIIRISGQSCLRRQ